MGCQILKKKAAPLTRTGCSSCAGTRSYRPYTKFSSQCNRHAENPCFASLNQINAASGNPHRSRLQGSRFCELYRRFERRLATTTRQTHAAGHKMFFNYSGKKGGIVDSPTGEIKMAEVLIGVLDASNLTYAKASGTQRLPD